MKGNYLILIELKNNVVIQIGKLGELTFKKGFYVYVGSALNRLEQRIQRHLRQNKKMHWHIDYLLKHAKITQIFYKEHKTREECSIAKTLEKELLIVPGFGCSDCNCKSHLFHGNYEKIKNAIDELNMRKYSF